MNTNDISINERLDLAVVEMKKLHAIESKKKNDEKQMKTDNRYNELVHQLVQLCRALHFAQVKFEFQYQPQTQIVEMLNDLERAANKGIIEDDFNSVIAKRIKSIQEETKTEWEKHYNSVVASTRSTLKIIKQIDPEPISKCLMELKNAEIWKNTDDDLPHLKTLFLALQNSNKIINQLNIDKEVANFLTKMSTNDATLNDISDEIMNWIQNKKLTDRIMISFR